MLAGVVVLIVALFAFQRLTASRDSTKIRQAIESVATGVDPSHCTEKATEGYLEQTTGEEAPFADEACESRAGEGAADSVDVRDIAIDGDRATAVVANKGGSFDGSRLVVRLIDRDGGWRLDRIVEFADFDRAKFRRAYRKRLLELGFPRVAAECVLGREQVLSDTEVERAALHPADSIFARFVVGCDREGVERNVTKAVSDPQLDFPKSAIECGRQRLKAATDAELVRIQLDAQAYNELLLACGREAFLDYYRGSLASVSDLDSASIDCVIRALRRLPSRNVPRVTYDQTRFGALIEGCESRR
ncbi:MAG TPA: hypothetical protein VLK89_07745 [Solirubrobacterales bacterium]|nr:hypothetical protein [Solirubrobacterales bacterium]